MFSKEKIIESFKVYTPKPLHFPLTSFGYETDDPMGDTPERRKAALVCSKLILAYMLDGQGKQTFLNPDDPAKTIITLGLADIPLREEIVLQIIRMMTRNPDPTSLGKAEELLAFCLMTFPVNKDFELYLYTWFGETYGRDSPKCKKFWAILIDMKYSQPTTSAKSIGELRKEWNELTMSRFALPLGKSSGPTLSGALTLT